MPDTRYFRLAFQTGQATDDDGRPVAWAACEDLPGAYAEAPAADEALRTLGELARRIIAEHLLRHDPLDPAIVATDYPEADHVTRGARHLTVAVRDADIEEVRNAPLLFIEQPEP